MGAIPLRAGRQLLLLAGIGLVHFLAEHAGLAAASINSVTSPVWPATGVALAAVFLCGNRVGWIIWASAFLANPLLGTSPLAAAAIATGTAAEAMLMAYLLKQWCRELDCFATPADYFRFVAVCAFSGTVVSATIGSVTVIVESHESWMSFAPTWATWWKGNLSGALLVAPVILLWLRPPDRDRRDDDRAGTVGALALAAGVGVVTFSPLIDRSVFSAPLPFLSIVPLMWTAYRGSQRDTATVALVLSGFAVWGVAAGGGPFLSRTPNETFLLLQSFILSVTVPSLALSAVLAKLRSRAAELETARSRQAVLLDELDHRARNILSSVLAIVHLTLGRSAEADAVVKRLRALAKSHDRWKASWRGMPLAQLVTETVEPFVGQGETGRTVVSGPPVVLNQRLTEQMSFILFELATNASKYGALSTLSGSIHVAWSVDAAGNLVFHWRETGGPAVAPPIRSGVGTKFIRGALGPDSCHLEFEADGLVCRLTFDAGSWEVDDS